MKALCLNDDEALLRIAGEQTIIWRRLKRQPPTKEHKAANPFNWTEVEYAGKLAHIISHEPKGIFTASLPFQVGEFRFVSETWAEAGNYYPPIIIYKADYPACVPTRLDNIPHINQVKWKSPVTMSEKFSRARARIVSMRLQRIQEVSPDDCAASGLVKLSKDKGRTWKYGIPDRDGLPGTDDSGWPWEWWRISPKDAFERFFGLRNPRAWERNEWIWRIELGN